MSTKFEGGRHNRRVKKKYKIMSTVRKLNKFISGFFENDLKKTDQEIFKSINAEFDRQKKHIELIASENIVSRAVLEAQGSVLTNKYAEGYSGKRYYGGCEFVDVAENLAIEELRNYLIQNMQMYNLIRGLKRTVQFIWRY